MINDKNIKNILLSLGWYESRIHTGLLRYAQENNWIVHADPHAFGHLTNISVDGLVLSVGGQQDSLKWAESLNIPFVGLFEKDLNVPSINMDEGNIGSMAADFFQKRGFKNFATFHPHPFSPNPRLQKRIDGFSNTVKKVKGNLNVCLREENPVELSTEKENNAKIEFYKSQLADLPRPLAVFVLQDSDATFFQMACMDLGLSIPEEIAIISVNNDPMICPYTPVPLSSIDPGWENVGYLAGSLLHRLINGEEVSNVNRIIPPVGVVERLSSSILAVEDPRVAAAVSYIWQNLDKDPTVEDVCDAVGVAKKNLVRAFSKHLGRGIKQEVQAARIRRIKTMLLESNLNTVEIAKKLNFNSEYYMYKFFKKHTGMTAKEFRQQVKPQD